MDKLAIHPVTRSILEAYTRQPSHALLLHGESGVGLRTIAGNLATQLDARAEWLAIEPDEKGTITIEMIHSLYQQTRSRRPDVRLVVLIDDIDTASLPAQNALLKLLEEPVNNVYFILTTHHLEKVLRTIRSRSSLLTVRLVDLSASQAFVKALNPNLPANKLQQLMFIAGGRPAELYRIANNEVLFEEKAKLVQDAKVMLSGSTYDKIKTLTKYEKSRHSAIELLHMVLSLLRFMALTKASADAALSSTPVEDAIQALQKNGHVKTHLIVLATSGS